MRPVNDRPSWATRLRPAHLVKSGLFVACSVLVSTPAQAAEYQPAGAGPIVAALDWIQQTLLGHVATAVAVIAVACVGFMMLTGRVNWRFGATVIVGCFVLFGAATIVAGIQTVSQ